ncbi:hypothetical protein C8R41DRAFT_818326 [Lentinula lateritia]|uniref:Uncharacterized protein n=1 Tax=Lentinula lateritia TaxID=40482 RepID=A0ABQ8VQG7_9AGAR|nr:hypothetical protein C8R41DRAFT_818326 [Lentinula lateritia]
MTIELSLLTHCFTCVLLMFTTSQGYWALLGWRVVYSYISCTLPYLLYFLSFDLVYSTWFSPELCLPPLSFCHLRFS